MAKKKTNKEFVKEVYNLVKDEYTVLSEYVNANTKIKLRHNTCKYEYYVKPSSFTSTGKRCPECSYKVRRVANKKTHSTFVKEISELVGGEYTVLGKYINSKSKIKMKHNECNHIWDVEPTSFLGTKNRKGSRCPKCYGTPKKTQKQYEKEVFELVGNEYTVLGDYKNALSKIKMIHNICNYEYEVEANGFLKGRRCPKCSGLMKKTHEQFLKEVYELAGDDYTVISKYKSALSKVKIRHNDCNYVYDVDANAFLKGNRCPQCAPKVIGNKLRKSHDDFIKQIENITGKEYIVLGEYKGNHTKIKMKHDICSHEWMITPSNFIQGNRCPNCSDVQNSKNVKNIENYLTENKIKYEREYRFDECRYKKPLPFDFAIFKDNKLMGLIEYDGEQHFKPIISFGGNKSFRLQIKKDQIKNDFCYKHNIPLIRVPYYIEDVSLFIMKELNKIDLMDDKNLLKGVKVQLQLF